jgi:choline dehydrogenase
MKYDVVIIGAGSAGCVLATRLTEDPQRSVLLLEVGPDYTTLEHYPDDLKYGYDQTASAVDAPHNWSFVGIPTPQQGASMPVPRGRVVGGSSAINGQVFLRGVPEDYDHWAALGNDEWTFRQVLPYFRKAETDTDIQDDLHGSAGPIPVRRHKPETWLPAQRAFYEACLAADFPADPDMNHPDSMGVGPIPMNNPDGIRMSTALTYLNPVRHRLNLTVKAQVLVRRLLFTGKQVTGVEVESGGERFIVEAAEVILTAGAIASPQLLMLSGVGPVEHLRSLGIPVLHALPGVGQNLRDHPNVRVPVRVKDDFPLDPKAPRTQLALRYTAQGSSDRNDMQILQSSFSSPIGGDPLQAEGIRFTCILELAVGAGELQLVSTDPTVQPRLDYRYLEDPWDRQRLRDAVRLCARLLEHEVYQDIVAERLEPSDQALASDKALDDWLLHRVTTTQHISGTCKMGPASDPLAVVDQHCRVHGLTGLRVADASVMPDVIRANTNATTIMIAERVADFVRQGM